MGEQTTKNSKSSCDFLRAPTHSLGVGRRAEIISGSAGGLWLHVLTKPSPCQRAHPAGWEICLELGWAGALLSGAAPEAPSPEAVKHNIHITCWFSRLTARKLPPGFTRPHPRKLLVSSSTTSLLSLKKKKEKVSAGSSRGEGGRSLCSRLLGAQRGLRGFGELSVFSCHCPHPFLVELGFVVRILLCAGTLQQHPLRRALGSAACGWRSWEKGSPKAAGAGSKILLGPCGQWTPSSALWVWERGSTKQKHLHF